MAVVNTKATAITNADATTQTLNKMTLSGGRVKSAAGTVEAVSGDSIGSTYRLARVPSNARVREVVLQCDAITTCAADFGLYDTLANGAAVVDADFFASAQSLAAALTGTNILREAGAAGGDVANVEKQIWEILGLTADPKKYYDIAATLTAAAGSAGTVSLDVGYVDGN